MDFMVYVRDDLGGRIKKAKEEHGLNYSRLFQNAAEAELERIDRAGELANDPQEFELDLRTPDGDAYVGLIRGRQLTKAFKRVTFYQRADGQVLMHDADRQVVVPIHAAGLESGYASREDYIVVSAALGETARVEL
jgi:hypothetical protein